MPKGYDKQRKIPISSCTMPIIRYNECLKKYHGDATRCKHYQDIMNMCFARDKPKYYSGP